MATVISIPAPTAARRPTVSGQRSLLLAEVILIAGALSRAERTARRLDDATVRRLLADNARDREAWYGALPSVAPYLGHERAILAAELARRGLRAEGDDDDS